MHPGDKLRNIVKLVSVYVHSLLELIRIGLAICKCSTTFFLYCMAVQLVNGQGLHAVQATLARLHYCEPWATGLYPPTPYMWASPLPHCCTMS